MFTSPVQITLQVRDVPESVDYYRRAFGFSFQGFWDPAARGVVVEWTAADQPAYAEVRAGESRIGLRPGPAAGTNSIELALTVDDLDDHCARVRAAGGTITDPERQRWGARMATAIDADGYRWNFLEPNAAS